MKLRQCGAIRGKRRILNQKGGEWCVFIFEAPKVLALIMSIKDRVDWALRNKHRFGMGTCGIYGAP
jgi:hypothetical protein